MPNINRIRVNNVKYNFGSQAYDDFTMRMYGKNTIYDLANGGGKSVLMLLLLQNMLPNSTLDEKQPIEKLFRSGNGNTVIHSLIEWKLDEPYEEGYRYMTTGFCARKAKEQENSEAEASAKDVCAVEYFNYCIRYREYNKNDIINLPLVKNGEKISYAGLRTYLKELGSNDMSLEVNVFDRRGEYIRFISGFGLQESQWEIIRGINKTEGHVRTYFENNYKTTRKVVEDLLIEEIIEKAFMVKTNRDENHQDSMAKLLMDIKDQLTLLAKKKKDISNYDYQMELIGVLSDKVASFINLYEEQDKLTQSLADIYVTGEKYVNENDDRLHELEAKRDASHEQKYKQRERIECLKVERDKLKLNELKSEADEISGRINELRESIRHEDADYELKKSINDYLLYKADKKRYEETDALIKTIRAGADYDDEQCAVYVYNIKVRLDKTLASLAEEIRALTEKINQARLDKEYHDKLITEAGLSLAAAESTGKKAKEEIEALSERLSKIRMSMNSISFVGNDEQREKCEEEIAKVKDRIKTLSDNEEETKTKYLAEQEKLLTLRSEKLLTKGKLDKLEEDRQATEAALNKLENICTVYGEKDLLRLKELISERITGEIVEIAEIKRQIKEHAKRIKELNDKRLIRKSEAVRKVLEYIETRHGITAMFGMDYISALPKDKQEELLDINPLLPYGVAIEDFDVIKDDPNLPDIDTDDTAVMVYDMKELGKKPIHIGENLLAIHAGKEYFLDDETPKRLIDKASEETHELELALEMKDKLIEAMRSDSDFVIRALESDILGAEDERKTVSARDKELEKLIAECEKRIKICKKTIQDIEEEIAAKQKYHEELIEDLNKLMTAAEISDLIERQEDTLRTSNKECERLKGDIARLNKEDGSSQVDISLLESKLSASEKQSEALLREWDDSYKDFYDPDKAYELLDIDDEELKINFLAMSKAREGDKSDIADKKLLMDTLKSSMDRSISLIKDRGISIASLEELDKKSELYEISEDTLRKYRNNLDELRLTEKNLSEELKNKNSEHDRLKGSIDYAIDNITQAFGAFTETEESTSLADIVAILAEGEETLKRLDKEAKEADEELKRYTREQSYMRELFKDVKRIVTTNDISTEDADIIVEDKDKLRDIFEESLIKYDKNTKLLDRAKNELMRFKGNTAQALDQMNMYEMAGTIRDDVDIPSSYQEALSLNDNLKSIIDYIRLEKDRVEKSLTDMETIKENFEEQCLQRCLDVRTELEKLPKLSRIVSEGETIQVVDLNIPYVKDEFLKQKMSDYIDKVVADADSYDNDNARMKYIRSSLALKKLFGVIVTDMNAIKLILYKRERIKEQSRYLKYEEAVGSTGQSQGIYIQFLIAVINYIAGMYQTQSDVAATKTIFIDNPFGAAKDVYIWEPIFELLKANRVQLIVPARGVTPVITGRFDVNYILGQQMSDNKTQLTVVTNYISKVDQEEVEYKDLEYEQVSFDFI